MEENKRIELGIRGEAKQAKASVILDFVLAVLCLGVAGLFAFAFRDRLALAISVFAIFGILGIFLVIAGISLRSTIKNSDSILDTPVLAYDPGEDCFICYDARKNNAEIKIKNGNIKAIAGSAFMSARGLSIRYLNDIGQSKGAFVGYCRNIDNGVLRQNINEYHKPKI